MPMFLNLPEALISAVLSHWLTILDAAHLDSAFCNSEQRPEFVKVAYEFGTLLQYPHMMNIWDKRCDRMNAWILGKGASVAGFFATRTFLLGDRKKYLQRHGHHIRWIDHACTWCHHADCSQHAMDLAQYCPRLTRLHAADSLKCDGLMRIIQHCPLLEDLKCASGCNDQVVMELSKTFSTLKRLDFDAKGLSEECLIALVRSNPGLLSFSTDADGATETFVFELARACTCLEKLALSCVTVTHASLCYLLIHCANMSSFSLIAVAYVPSEVEFELPKCVSMRTFVAADIQQNPDTLSQLGALIRACPNLTSLDLWQCPALPENAILPLSARFPSLQIISLSRCGCRVGEELLLDISAHYPQLRKLDVPFSDDVTDVGLVAVATSCPLLKSLDITCCHEVTDATLFALAENTPGLKVLMLAECGEVTDAGITAVMQGCPALNELCVEDCWGLTEKLALEVAEWYL